MISAQRCLWLLTVLTHLPGCMASPEAPMPVAPLAIELLDTHRVSGRGLIQFIISAHIDNSRQERRWLLMPFSATDSKVGPDRINVIVFDNVPPIGLVSLFGVASFRALPLAANAKVTIQDFTVDALHEGPELLRFWLAEEVLLNGRPLEEYLPDGPSGIERKWLGPVTGRNEVVRIERAAGGVYARLESKQGLPIELRGARVHEVRLPPGDVVR